MRTNSNRLRALTAALAIAFAGTAFSAESELSQDIADASHEAQIWTTYGFNPHLRALDLSVEVNGDLAILTGSVDSAVAKDLAEQIALGTDGINRVDNLIKVDPDYVAKTPQATDKDRDFSTRVDDATITASVKSKLMWNDHTDGLEINVDTAYGKVTLSGTADSATARDLATQLARNTEGVSKVDNRLTIDSSQPGTELQQATSDTWITSKVKSTLLLTRNVSGLEIEVSTDNGVVSLQGTVDSGAERDTAIELARDIRGVKKVDASGLSVS